MLSAASQDLPLSQEAQLWGAKNQHSHVLAVDAAGSILYSQVTLKAALCKTYSDMSKPDHHPRLLNGMQGLNAHLYPFPVLNMGISPSAPP